MSITSGSSVERPFLILDFGSQLTQLIARRLRELNYYSEILPFNASTENLKQRQPLGIILSGGPNSVYEAGAPQRSVKELSEIAPLLGICYGMQLIAQQLGGVVKPSSSREYGASVVTWDEAVEGVPVKQNVWMSHGDIVEAPPPQLRVVATSSGGHPAALKGDRIWALQFHPEVAHTEHGRELLQAFATQVCGVKPNWSTPHVLEVLQTRVIQQVGKEDHVLCALSGGVDSTVVATLLTKTLSAERVHCLFINNGLLRQGEYESVLSNYQNLGLNIRGVDARAEFLTALRDIEDPETKRKTIGRVFIEVFEKYQPDQRIKWLAQGTLYPDVIESSSAFGGPSQTIKSHHNVGGLPDKLKLKLLEPVRELFKDEVRAIGKLLQLPDTLLLRHPFPGPGLAIRVLGAITEERLQVLRAADEIFIRKLREHELYHKIWQAFCVLLPVKTVGVQGDGRTYENVLSLRAVTSSDGMTADWFAFPPEFLREVSNLITNHVRGINRVVYDITSKPPATIEWE